MKLFQYVCFLDSEDSSKIVVDVTTVVAKDMKAAEIIAARAIPKKYSKQLNDIKVVVRPFDTNPVYYTYYYGYGYPYTWTNSYLNSSGNYGVNISNTSGTISSVTNNSLNTAVVNSIEPSAPNYSSVADLLKTGIADLLKTETN